MENEKKTFSDLLREWERTADTDTNDPERVNALQTLATACAFSVISKVYQASGNPVILSLKRQLAHDLTISAYTGYALDQAYEEVTNADGERGTVTKDRAFRDGAKKLCRDSFGDGLDLVHVAIIAILEESQKVDHSGEWLESPYMARRLKKRVRIKKDDSVNGWETVETCPIREVYKAIRRYIMQSSAVQTASHKYTYIDDLTQDPESDEVQTCYYRLPKYSNLAGEVTDVNGKLCAITADENAVEIVEKLVTSMNLSPRETTVLQYRLSGYGTKAIATAMGVTENSCKGALHRIREKARENGFEPKD